MYLIYYCQYPCTSFVSKSIVEQESQLAEELENIAHSDFITQGGSTESFPIFSLKECFDINKDTYNGVKQKFVEGLNYVKNDCYENKDFHIVVFNKKTIKKTLNGWIYNSVQTDVDIQIVGYYKYEQLPASITNKLIKKDTNNIKISVSISESNKIEWPMVIADYVEIKFQFSNASTSVRIFRQMNPKEEFPALTEQCYKTIKRKIELGTNTMGEKYIYNRFTLINQFEGVINAIIDNSSFHLDIDETEIDYSNNTLSFSAIDDDYDLVTSYDIEMNEHNKNEFINACNSVIELLKKPNVE